MKRDEVITCLLLVNACLLVYASIQVWQRPSLYDIDARIEYWHDYYREVDRARMAKTKSHDETNPAPLAESAAADVGQTPDRNENATVTDSATGTFASEQSSEVASRLNVDEN